MITIRSIATACEPPRLRARFKLTATRLGSLILLFQRMPVVQFLFPEASIIGSASVGNTVSLAVTTVVGLGVFDSVAGQSQISQTAPLVVLGKEPAGDAPTAPNAINVPATVSAPLNFGFDWDPTDEFSPVKSWRCTTGGVAGTLPAGLSPASDSNSTDANGVTVGVGTTIPITGTPAASPGIYPVTVTVYRNTGFSGTDAAQIFNICVLGFTTQPAGTTINSGQTANLSFTAAGIPVKTTLHNVTPTVTYQWYSGTSGTGPAIQGASGTISTASPSASYTTPANLSGSNHYWVKITSTLSGRAVSANSTTAVVNVTPALSPFENWASGLPVGQSGPLDTPQGDGVTNLEKFAFNMNALAPDVRHLTVGANGTTGLPGATLAAGKLRIEFLRRKSSTSPGITYTPQFSSNIGTWDDFGGSPASVSDVGPGTEWERVVVDDPNPASGTKRFGRVKVARIP